MKQLLVYAHFNPNTGVAAHVLHTLRAFRAAGVDIVFATTSSLDGPAEEAVSIIVDQIIAVENIGYDFFAWKTALREARPRVDAADRLILLNSSVVGPVFSLARFLATVESNPSDIVAATISHERAYHMQSWFLYVKRSALDAPAFHSFWDELTPIADRQGVIDNYELTMTRYFMDRGLTVGAFFEAHNHKNPTLSYPYRLLARRLPFIKIELLRDNPRGVFIWPIRRLLPLGLNGVAPAR